MEDLPVLNLDNPLRMDFSGSWEKDFRRSDNKLAYAYLLTPKGVEEKARVTVNFFRRVEVEYEALKQEMENLGRQG